MASIHGMPEPQGHPPRMLTGSPCEHTLQHGPQFDIPPMPLPPPSPPMPHNRTLPDPAICQAKNSGLAAYADFADCLVETPLECTYALRFGMRYLCHHPDRAEIVKVSSLKIQRTPRPT